MCKIHYLIMRNRICVLYLKISLSLHTFVDAGIVSLAATHSLNKTSAGQTLVDTHSCTVKRTFKPTPTHVLEHSDTIELS